MNVSQTLGTCDTGLIRGLSLQVLEKLIADKPGVLSRVNHPLINVSGRQNNPYIQSDAYRALVKAVEARGTTLKINSCLRTPMQQHLIFQEFQRGKCGITAAARPPRSNHNSGLAFDTNDYNSWKSTLGRYQWKWLGDGDPFHFDYAGGGQNLGNLQVEIFQQLWNENNPGDQIAVDGLWGTATANRVDKSPANGFGNPSAPTTGRSTLRVGSRGDDVRYLQSKLGITADGIFGAQTEAKVKAFQSRNGLSADGIVGSRTWAKLDASGTSSPSPSPSPTPKPTRATLRVGSRGDDVRYLQSKLKITADGIFGSQTETAVKTFQSRNGLSEDGIVGPMTWAKLG